MKSDNELIAWIGQKIDSSINDEDGDLSDRRQTLLNYYRGEPFGNERRGESKVVTREAFEAVEWAMPLILKAFTGEDCPCHFDPVSVEDIPKAEQETDYVRHMMLKQSGGFLALHQWFKDTLMYPNGYLKVYPKKYTKTTVEEYYEQDPQQAAALASDPEVEVLEQRTYPVRVQADIAVEPTVIEVTDIKLRRREDKTDVCIESVPPEHLLVDDQVRSIDLEKANFICHKGRYTYSELVAMGYDADKLLRVGSYDDFQWNDETVNRLFPEDENPEDGAEDAGPNAIYWRLEVYGWYDFDDDGVSEFRRIVSIGSTIFENEEIDYQPFIALSTIVQSHQHSGISLVETVDDLQLIISTLMRNLLNNIYRINKPRKYLNESGLLESGLTTDALMDAAAEIIPMRGDPRAAVLPEEIPSLVSEILPVIRELDGRTATRTGIAPQLSLDPTTLQQSTMGAFMGALDKANERLDMIIRVFAEMGMRPLMQKMHHCIRKYQDIEAVVQLRGEWVTVDPREWDERNDITVQVGLGFTNKGAMLQVFQQLLQLQREAISQGMSDPKRIYRTIEKMSDVVGINAFEHFIDPMSEEYQPPQPPPPDPAMVLAQQQLEMQGQQMQADMQLQVREEQRKTQEMSLKYADLQGQMAKLAAEIEKIRADAALTQARTGETAQKAQAQAIENEIVTAEAISLAGVPNA